MNQQQRDIEEERRRASFNVRQLTYFLQGGEEVTKRLETIRDMVAADPFFDKQNIYFLSHKERYEQGLEKFRYFREMLASGKLNHLSRLEQASFEGLAVGYHGMSLHQAMFLPSLRNQADDEQQAKWIPLAENYDIIGCYAQTEMGHGSNVRGLETLATFDPEKDEFIMHSPTLTSTKWWPGALGKSANYALVYARLILPTKDGKQVDKGVHAFMVPIRSLTTHETLPGVTTGMIGPRYGTNDNDNGFLRLDQVRIPRRNMLMRHNQVERDGSYHLVNDKAKKLNYGTMLLIRSGIVERAGVTLGMAVTVATRYSAVRRQFPQSGDSGEESEAAPSSSDSVPHQPVEQKVLDYQAQQYRVLPLLATSYALRATGKDMRVMFNELQRGISSGVLDSLPEAHATSSGLKAVTTILASEGIEECRKACGGHGYLLNSGLCELFTSAVSSNTLEGENYLIIQQLSRYLIKSFKGAQAGKAPLGNAKYQSWFVNPEKVTFKSLQINQPHDFIHTQNQLNAYAIRAGHLIAQTVRRLDENVKKGQDFASAMQSIQWLAIRAAKAHCMYTILLSFVNFVDKSRSAGAGIQDALRDLCHLFALYHMEKELGEFLEAGAFSARQSEWIHESVEQMLTKVRPNAVPLVDAFNFSDRDLNSALGRYDGNVYEALYNWTKLDPLNAKNVPDVYEKAIGPIVKKQFNSKL